MFSNYIFIIGDILFILIDGCLGICNIGTLDMIVYNFGIFYLSGSINITNNTIFEHTVSLTIMPFPTTPASTQLLQTIATIANPNTSTESTKINVKRSQHFPFEFKFMIYYFYDDVLWPAG